MAKAVCVPCIGTEISAAIAEANPDLGQILKKIKPCADPRDIIFCLPSRAKRTGEKRAPSEYNLFVKDCMTRRPEGLPAKEHMKTCALEYRRKKGRV